MPSGWVPRFPQAGARGEEGWTRAGKVALRDYKLLYILPESRPGTVAASAFRMAHLFHAPPLHARHRHDRKPGQSHQIPVLEQRIVFDPAQGDRMRARIKLPTGEELESVALFTQ